MSHPVELKVEDLLSFIHHPIFTADWKGLGLDDDDLAELELCVMVTPEGHGVVEGTRDVRMMKVITDPRENRVPIAVIVCFVLFPHRSIAAFMTADAADTDLEGEVTDEERSILSALIREISEGLVD